MRVAVMAVECPLGLPIAVGASTLAFQVRADTRDPTRWSTTGLPVPAVRGDLPDVSHADVVMRASDVVVVPFGSGDTREVDVGSDPVARAVLGRARRQIESSATHLVVARRPRTAADPVPAWSNRHHRARQAWRHVAARAALGTCATHVRVPWTSVWPYGTLCSSEVRGRSDFLPPRRSGDAGRARASSDHGPVAAVPDAVARRRGAAPSRVAGHRTPSGRDAGSFRGVVRARLRT